MPKAKTALLTIPNGAALSESVLSDSDTIVGLYMPAGWTAADIAFLASMDNSTFADVVQFGSRLQLQVAVDQFIPIDPVPLLGIKYLKLESVDAAGVAVNQGAARSINLVYRSFQ